MERWTIVEPSEGRFRLHINHGGKPFWCMFDFAVGPATGRIRIELAADADPVSIQWFPHLRAGMVRGLEAARGRGREWVGVRIEIRKIHAHPIDTTAYACERYGASFIYELTDRGVLLPDQPRPGP